MISLLNIDFSTLLFPVFFVVIFMCCMSIVMYLQHRRKNKAMVKKIQQGGFGLETWADSRSTKKTSADQTDKPFALLLKFFSGKPKEKELTDPSTLQLKFLRAGIRTKNFEAVFWGIKCFLPIIFVGLFLFLKFFVFMSMGNPATIVFIVILGLIGFYLPELWLKNKTDNRKISLFRALPDALDLMVVCVEAGMGLDSALLKVGQEIQYTYPDLSREFSYLNLEMRAGKSRQAALKNLARRTGIDEMNSLVTLLIQTDKFGTSVATALKVFSDSFRTKRYQLAEEMAAKLPVKILIPLILFIFPALFVVILGPAAMTIYKNIIMR